MESAKQKLDKMLGIKDGESIDDFLNDLSTDSDKLENTLSSIDDSMKETIQKVDNSLNQLSCNTVSPDSLAFNNVESGLSEIRELIDISKRVVMHIYQSVITTDLVDPELISAMAKLIEATHINIADYLDLYKQRVVFYDKIKLMNYQQQLTIEKMKLKHQFDMEKNENKNMVAAPEGMVSITQEEMIKMLNDGTLIDDNL